MNKAKSATARGLHVPGGEMVQLYLPWDCRASLGSPLSTSSFRDRLGCLMNGNGPARAGRSLFLRLKALQRFHTQLTARGTSRPALREPPAAAAAAAQREQHTSGPSALACGKGSQETTGAAENWGWGQRLPLGLQGRKGLS